MMKGRFIKDITFFSLAEAFAGIVYFLFILVSPRLLGVVNFGLFQVAMVETNLKPNSGEADPF